MVKTTLVVVWELAGEGGQMTGWYRSQGDR